MDVPPSNHVIGGCSRVTLVGAFGFLFQNFGRCLEPMNGTLSFYEYSSIPLYYMINLHDCLRLYIRL